MWTFLTTGVGFGVMAGALPGPFISYVISSALAGGWRRGLATIFAPLVADIPFIIAAVFILKQVPTGLVFGIQIAGGLYLLWLAWGAYKDYRKGVSLKVDDRPVSRSFWQAVVLIYLGPGPYIFWGSIIGPKLVEALNLSLMHGALLLIGFYGTFLAVLSAYVAVFSQMRRLDDRYLGWIYLVTLLLMAYFGVKLSVEGVAGLMAG